MNHVDRNWINNFIYRYRIKDTAEIFNKLREVIKQRKFYIYRTILYIIDNCRIVEEDSTGITAEICLDEHRNLLEDLTNNFVTEKIRTRKVESKVGHGYTTGNPFLAIKIDNGFDDNNREPFPRDKPRKLKNLALPSVYYRLLNTSYIFTYNSYLYCWFGKFQGCGTKPINAMTADQNYCMFLVLKLLIMKKKSKVWKR